MTLFVVLGDSGDVTKDLAFSLRMRWPDAEVLGETRPARIREVLETNSVDLLFVESALASSDPAVLLEQVRSFSDVPVVVLARNSSDVDRARALECGADDCVNYPGSALELLARCKAVMRRARGQGFGNEQPMVVRGDLRINPNTAEVALRGNRVELTPTEYRLLMVLVRNQGSVVSNQALLQRVWGADYRDESGFLKSYVYRLRRKLEKGSGPQMIITERGHGYRFVALSQTSPIAPAGVRLDQRLAALQV